MGEAKDQDSLISLAIGNNNVGGKGVFGKGRRTSLPVIKGVNQKSLSMLIDQPQMLMKTPRKNGNMQSRNLSIGIPQYSAQRSGQLSPLKGNIV